MGVKISSAWDDWNYNQNRNSATSNNLSWDYGNKAVSNSYWYNYNVQKYVEAHNFWGSPEWSQTDVKENSYYTYNPALREWEKISFSEFDTDGFLSSTIEDAGSLSFSPSSTGVVSQSGVVDSQKDSATSSKAKAEKDYIEVEFNTLVGEINLIPTKENMRIKTNTTINLVGVGKYLSGLYFVSEVKKSMSSEGYTLTVGLYKNGFGKSLKAIPEPKYSDRPIEVSITDNTISSHLKVGDKVKIVGDEAVYSNAHEGIKIPEYVKEQVLTIDALSDDGLRARLSPIFSWTYTKFLQLM